jgi:hypothetical protein
MFDPAHFYQDLAGGIPLIGLGSFFVWKGFRKEMGKNSRPWIFLGGGFIVSGALELLGLL